MSLDVEIGGLEAVARGQDPATGSRHTRHSGRAGYLGRNSRVLCC